MQPEVNGRVKGIRMKNAATAATGSTVVDYRRKMISRHTPA
jgi:hypothetical protein